ncbi:MAG: VanZ family protein [Mobilitalea sp.]
MQRRSSIQVSSLIILLSILTIILQFMTYYFFASFVLILGISSLISMICCHLLIEQTASYESCFQYSVLTIFISVIVFLLSYFGGENPLLPYSNAMLGIIVINWFLPNCHSFLRNMLGYGTKIEDFSLFYRNSMIVFSMFYIVLLLYADFAPSAFPLAYQNTLNVFNLKPFWTVSGQIEDYLYELIPIRDIFIYLASRILTFIPFGFIVTLILREQSRLLRLLALLSVPFLLEFFQYFIFPSRCDIDDIIYALLGGVIGSLLFYLINLIFRAFSGSEFLSNEGSHKFSGSTLHF